MVKLADSPPKETAFLAPGLYRWMPSLRSATIAALRQRIVSGEKGGLPAEPPERVVRDEGGKKAEVVACFIGADAD